MHDIRMIRDNPAAFDAALSRRGIAPVSSEILTLDEERRSKILAAETAQADANAKILDDVFANTNIGLGVTLFSFLDGWWKAGNPDIQDEGGTAPNSTGVPYDGVPNEE